MIVPKFVHLYRGTAASELDAEALAAFLREQVQGITIDVRDDFLVHALHRDVLDEESRNALARNLAKAKVLQPNKENTERKPLPGEVAFERKFIAAGDSKPAGIMYDGFHLVALYAELLQREEANLRHCHMVLTNQLFGTWDENDCRYHARVSVYAFPALISTRGLVDAPARPREFYFGRMLGAGQAHPEETMNDQYLGHGDPRFQEALKGYLLQALFYQITGDPFCDDKDCRLFNAHWQAELIHAQLRPDAGLCKRHGAMLNAWARV